MTILGTDIVSSFAQIGMLLVFGGLLPFIVGISKEEGPLIIIGIFMVIIGGALLFSTNNINSGQYYKEMIEEKEQIISSTLDTSNNLSITLSVPRNEKEKEIYNNFIKTIKTQDRIIDIKTVNDNIEITIRKK